jgi:GNAT superfamily N-acetyltransferase
MISEEVRRYAEDPAAWADDPPPESGLRRTLTDRYCVLLGPVPSFTSISRLRVDPDEVAETLAEVRSIVTQAGHTEAIWWVGASATPADLADRLQAHGLRPANGGHWEPHATAMVLSEEPPPAPPEVVARRVESLEEFRLADRISGRAFEVPEAEQDEWDAIAEERFAAERADHSPRTYLGFVDGEPVAVARGLVEPDAPAVLLIGGGVLPEARGRGLYRALVRARWDEAVASGKPALVTQAGAMSRPILERLGFEPVAEIEILLDPHT